MMYCFVRFRVSILHRRLTALEIQECLCRRSCLYTPDGIGKTDVAWNRAALAYS